MANTPAQLARQRRYRESHREELRRKGREYMANRRASDPEFAEHGRERIRTLTVERPEHLAVIRQKSYRKHAEKRRAESRDYALEAYGLCRERLDEMYAKQNGRCAICKTEYPLRAGPAGMHIDHDHKSGAVRGLLCGNCNHALGKFRDDVAVLKAAIAYLETAGGESVG